MTVTPAEPDRRTSGPAMWAVNAALAAPLVGFTTKALHLPLWFPALCAAVAAVVVVAAAARMNAGRKLIVFRLVCLAAALAWAVWLVWLGPSMGLFVALLLGGVLAAGVAPSFAPLEVAQPLQMIAGVPAPALRDALVMKWEQLLNQALQLDKVRGGNGPGVVIQGIDQWQHRTGYTVRVEFPLGSRLTFRDIQTVQLGLAGALRLPKGCPIRVDEGEHQGSAVIKVSTVNDLAARIPFPTGYAQRSVTQPFALGLLRDRQEAVIDAYQSSGLIAGMRGSGKTILLHVYTAWLAQCVDAVVWHVDLNGGSMAAPWISPYANGTLKRPAVDWVATTPEEAIRLAAVATQIAKDRKARYQRLLVERNVDVLPVTADLPAIIIIVDEGGEVMGEDASPEAQRAARELRELQRIGRAMCVNVVFSVMRGTSTYVPAGMKKLTYVKVCMGVDGDDEVAYVMDWVKGLRANDLTSPGSGFLRYGKEPPEMFKGYALLPQDIEAISAATATWHPQLDPAAARVGGDTYAQRWQRDDTRQWLQVLAGGDLDDMAVTEVDVDAKVAGELPAAVMAAGLTRFADDFAARLAAQAAEPRSAVAVAERPTGGGDARPAVESPTARVAAGYAAAHAAGPGGPGDGGGPGGDGGGEESGAEYAARIIASYGPAGTKTQVVVEAAFADNRTVRRATVSEWIKDANQNGWVETVDWATWVATEAWHRRAS